MANADLWALSDLCTPWCVHVVATLRIADHIAVGDEEINRLATAAGCDADALQRVLRHLVGEGVFDEPERGRFALNEAARGLLEPGARPGLDLDGFGGRMAHAWGTLPGYVRTGAPTYDRLFGRPFWEDLEAHPKIAAEFDALMGPDGHGTPDPEVLIVGDWDAVRTVVDVGGGTGALLTSEIGSGAGNHPCRAVERRRPDDEERSAPSAHSLAPSGFADAMRRRWVPGRRAEHRGCPGRRMLQFVSEGGRGMQIEEGYGEDKLEPADEPIAPDFVNRTLLPRQTGDRAGSNKGSPCSGPRSPIRAS